MWKILVVDDNFVNRILLIDILEDLAVCDAAANGKEAIDAYNLAVENAEPYDLVLLDIAMPEVDGITFLRAIRENEKRCGVKEGKGIPVIMVTAYPEEFIPAFNSGCDDFVLKPVNGEKLIQKIKEKLDTRDQ